MPDRPVRVLLADADRDFGSHLAGAFEGRDGIAFLGCAFHAADAIRMALLRSPDILFLAADMAEAAETILQITRLLPQPPRIIVMWPEQGEVVAHTAGPRWFTPTAIPEIAGYVRKSPDAADLLAVVAALASATPAAATDD